jgi:hypothetical protein
MCRKERLREKNIAKEIVNFTTFLHLVFCEQVSHKNIFFEVFYFDIIV